MRFEVVLPSLGDEDDAVQGGAVALWSVEVGDTVNEGGDLLEITTDKAAFVVPSPKTGTLVEKCVAEDDAVKVGDVLAVLEVAS